MPFGLILGSDSLSVDEPCGGTLRFSGHWILTNVCVTQADILTRVLPSMAECSSTDEFLHPPLCVCVCEYQLAQQLFQRDAQTITPEALENVKPTIANSEIKHKAETKKKAIPRKVSRQSWADPLLTEWPRMITNVRGDLGNEVMTMSFRKLFHDFLHLTWPEL
ncbi:hypothetical protein K1719_035338 [Acacia pycnantha]|nr:hypothetical protein K1719_035338 [Acacia pycnantha]